MTVSLQVSYSTDGHDVVFEVFGLDPSQTATLTFTDSTKSQIASFNVTPGDNGVALQAFGSWICWSGDATTARRGQWGFLFRDCRQPITTTCPNFSCD